MTATELCRSACPVDAPAAIGALLSVPPGLVTYHVSGLGQPDDLHDAPSDPDDAHVEWTRRCTRDDLDLTAEQLQPSLCAACSAQAQRDRADLRCSGMQCRINAGETTADGIIFYFVPRQTGGVALGAMVTIQALGYGDLAADEPWQAFTAEWERRTEALVRDAMPCRSGEASTESRR